MSAAKSADPVCRESAPSLTDRYEDQRQGTPDGLTGSACRRHADEARDDAGGLRQSGDVGRARARELDADALDDLAELRDLGNTDATFDEVRHARIKARVEQAPTLGALRAVDGGRILDDVVAFFRRFVAFPSEHAAHAVALWCAHAHALDYFESSPRLALLSPEPGSGKTRTLEVIELLVPNPMHALNAAPAPIFRTIERERPTLLFDEVDALFGRRPKSDDPAADLRAILNAGHRIGGSVARCEGPRHEVRRFPVYAAVALAGLGDLPDTLMSRSVIVRMRRRAPGEHVESFRIRLAEPQGRRLRDRIATWSVDTSDRLTDAWPDMPPGVTDRAADCWEALLAIADAAGGHWPSTARAACVELVKVTASREASLGIRLLADLRTVFDDEDRLATETILHRLHKLDEAPWGDLRGRPLDARGLARRIADYGIRSTKVKIAGDSLRGYRREDLHDAWVRYLPIATPRDTEPTEPEERASSDGLWLGPTTDAVPEPAQASEPSTGTLTRCVPEVPHVPNFQGAEPSDQDLGAWCSDDEAEL